MSGGILKTTRPRVACLRELGNCQAKTVPVPIVEIGNRAKVPHGRTRLILPRNAGPMLSSPRCGAKTRSGEALPAACRPGAKGCMPHAWWFDRRRCCAPQQERTAGCIHEGSTVRKLNELMRQSHKLILKIQLSDEPSPDLRQFAAHNFKSLSSTSRPKWLRFPQQLIYIYKYWIRPENRCLSKLTGNRFTPPSHGWARGHRPGWRRRPAGHTPTNLVQHRDSDLRSIGSAES